MATGDKLANLTALKDAYDAAGSRHFKNGSVEQVYGVGDSRVTTLGSAYIRASSLADPGAIVNPSGTASVIWFQAEADGLLWVETESENKMELRVSAEQPQVGRNVAWTGVLYDTDDAEHPVPTASAKLSVTAGQWIAAYQKGDAFRIHYAKNAEVLKDYVPLTPQMRAEVQAMIAEVQALVLENNG